MAIEILYKPILADTQVATTECYLDGIETAEHSELMVYDETDSSKTAAKLVSNIEASTYYTYNNIIFPSPGIKCDGIYVDWQGGSGTIYYHYGKSDKAAEDILYKTIRTADTLVTTLPCYLVGAEISSGTIAIYDEPNSDTTAGNLICTMKLGSYRHYNRKIFSEPIKCRGLYADITSGEGTIYYYLA